MLINLRNALMDGKRLPYDAEVEYLESTGTQYINTGIDTAIGLSVDTTFAYTAQTFYGILFGVQSPAKNFLEVRLNGNLATLTALVRNAVTTMAAVTFNNVNRFVGKWTSTGADLDLNGTTYTSTAGAVTGSANYPLYIFAGNQDNASVYHSKARVYSFKIINANGILVRDYIPVRKGTVGYLYDRVTRKLFGNAGTGDFVLGQDVVPVEWLQSSGWEYIDTGAIPDDTTGIEVVHTICPNNGTDNIIFGARQDSGNTRYWSNVDWGTFDSIGWGFNVYSGNSERFALTSSDVGRVITNSLNYMNDRAGKIDGVTYDSSLQNKTLATFSRSIYLFGANNQGTVGVRGIFKVYSAKISKGQTLANKFLPVRVGTEGAMMDTLTRRIYRNAGTGAFSYGNDLKYPIPA